jgi:membrane-associated protease RseP (regulator of RpoE activity)
MGILVLACVAAWHVGLLALARLLLRRASKPAATSWRARLGVPITATAASYLAAAVLCTAAALLAGGPYVPPNELDATVRVVPGSPADEAGLVDGDRIVSLDGAPVAHFAELAPRIQASEGPVTVELERSGRVWTVFVQPREGRIGVQAVRRQQPLGFVDAVAVGLRTPFRVAQYLMPTTDPPEANLDGPVGIVREVELPTARQRVAEWLVAFGAAHALMWPFLWLAAVIWGPARPKEEPSSTAR